MFLTAVLHLFILGDQLVRLKFPPVFITYRYALGHFSCFSLLVFKFF